MKRIFILNLRAGEGKNKRIEAAIRETFPDGEIVFTEHAGHAREIAKESVDSIVYAIGGDGTVNEVLQGVAGNENAMCVIPNGSGNDFARMIYPNLSRKERTPEALIRRSKEMKIKKVDCIKANDTYCANIASVGFDAEVVKNSMRFKKMKGLKRFSYIFALLQTIFTYHGTHLSGTLGDRPFDQDALLFCVANGQYYGGGIHIAPEAEYDDGQAEAYLIETVSSARFVSILPKLAKGKHTHLNEVHRVSGTFFTVEGKGLTLNLDGELSQADSVTFSLLKGGLNLLVP